MLDSKTADSVERLFQLHDESSRLLATLTANAENMTKVVDRLVNKVIGNGKNGLDVRVARNEERVDALVETQRFSFKAASWATARWGSIATIIVGAVFGTNAVVQNGNAEESHVADETQSAEQLVIDPDLLQHLAEQIGRLDTDEGGP